MNVYLRLDDDGKPRFEFPTRRAERHPEPATHGGLRGWLERKAESLKASWNGAEHGVTARARHLWERLHRHMPADESALARLRSADLIEIHHPAHLSCDEVRAHWSAYLARSSRRHLPWLGVNMLLSPLSLVLAPLPGPNVVGYWFAYRAVRDFLAVLGCRHARGCCVETTLHPCDALEGPHDDPHAAMSVGAASDVAATG